MDLHVDVFSTTTVAMCAFFLGYAIVKRSPVLRDYAIPEPVVGGFAVVIPIVLRGSEAEREQLAMLRNINVYSSATGQTVPLMQIAELSSVWEPYRINRRNHERTVTVSAKHVHLTAGPLFERLQPAMQTLDLPPGFRWEMGGELESSATAQERLFANFPLAGLVIVFLLVLQFNSFRRAGIILLTVPMAFLGAIIGLLSWGRLLVSCRSWACSAWPASSPTTASSSSTASRPSAAPAYDAILSASLSRFRPIIVTTLTTIPGLLPLIVWRDPLFYSMAVVIAFGALLGTVLTLGMVPVLYALLTGVQPARTGR